MASPLSSSASLLRAFATTLYVITGDGSLDDNKNDTARRVLVQFVVRFERLIPELTALTCVVDTLATTNDLFKHVMLVHEAHWSVQIGFDPEEIMRLFMDSARVSPRVWGPPLWLLLHALADSGGDNGGNVRIALKCLTVLLPCGACRADLETWLTERAKSVDDDDGGDVSALVIDLHNHVNRKLGKNIQVLF
jgi:hypothetical protein